jgi:hypothetical protein
MALDPEAPDDGLEQAVVGRLKLDLRQVQVAGVLLAQVGIDVPQAPVEGGPELALAPRPPLTSRSPPV